jgi:hypothetical protein
MLGRATLILLLMTGTAYAEKFSPAYYDKLAADCRQVMKATADGGMHNATKQQIAEGLCLLIKIETRLPSGSPRGWTVPRSRKSLSGKGWRAECPSRGYVEGTEHLEGRMKLTEDSSTARQAHQDCGPRSRSLAGGDRPCRDQ